MVIASRYRCRVSEWSDGGKMAAPGSLPRQRLYSLARTPAGPSQMLYRLYHRILAPMTLFPAARQGQVPPAEARGPSPEPPAQRTIPVPISLKALLQLVKGRLKPGPQGAQAPEEAREAFREIILDEVRRAFQNVQRSLHDPAFSAQVNRELYQYLVIYVVLACQHLFLHYLAVLEERRALKVYTDYANLVRFSALLSLDCASFLNVTAVRHRLTMELKALQLCSPPELPAEDFTPRLSRRAGYRLGFGMSDFIELVTPQVLTLKQKMTRDLKELQDIPCLDMGRIHKMNLPPAEHRMPLRKAASAAATTYSQRGSVKLHRVKWVPSGHIKGSQSLPNMRAGKLLADELGIRLTPRPLSPDLPLFPCRAEATEDDYKGPEALAEDLRRLVQVPPLKGKEEQDEESELPPLIKALTWRKSNEIHQQQLQRMLYALQREETFETKRRSTVISAPASQPQAATVNLTLHNKMVVKAADIQVSERIYVEAMGMEMGSPVYNHLLGEISNATLKALDANLSAGEEVKDIYKELANTIPKEHLNIDLGPLTEPSAYSIDLSNCFASSTLSRRKSQRVINEELSKVLPTGPFTPAEVVDTPTTPSLPLRKKLPAKAFTSWFQWWKATFNTDDYLKYIGTKNSDYLPVLFHLYSFEEDEEEAAKLPVLDLEEIQRQEKLKQEAIKKAAEIQKREFQAGQWKPKSSVTKNLEALVSSFGYKSEELRVFQRRLERLWTVLHFSEQDRLEMAIKYSSNQYYLLLPDMLEAWEEAAQYIQNRELLLTELEIFEATASDPNRFFITEPQGFALRVKESRTRNRLHAELAQYESQLRSILNHIKEAFNDTVTYRGQPYLKKMAWDTVEMLYWLQQERRANVLKQKIQKGAVRQKSCGPL